MEKETVVSLRHKLRSLKVFEIALSFFSRFIIIHDIYEVAIVCFITVSFLLASTHPPLTNGNRNRSKKRTVSVLGKPHSLLHIRIVSRHCFVTRFPCHDRNTEAILTSYTTCYIPEAKLSE